MISHDYFEELIPLYAINALEEDESKEVASHLINCAECNSLLDSYRGAVAALSYSSEPPNETLWYEIQNQINAEAGVKKVHVMRPLNRVRWIARSIAAFVVLVGILTISLLSIQVSNLDHKVAVLSEKATSGQISSAAQSALLNANAKRIALFSNSGTQVGEIVILPDGTAFLFNSGLKAVSREDTYQLWAIVNNNAVSLGLLGNNPKVVAMSVDPNVKIAEFAITKEKAGGVVVSKNKPLAVS
jgi:hypothetical protein